LDAQEKKIDPRKRKDPLTAMESIDVLNQIHRSNNEVILGCDRNRRRGRVLGEDFTSG